MNHESIFWSHEPKICKTSIFHELFFLKYDNFTITSANDICLYICLELNKWGLTIKEQVSVEWFSLFLATSLYIKIRSYYENFFSRNNIFFLIPTLYGFLYWRGFYRKKIGAYINYKLIVRLIPTIYDTIYLQ